MKRIFQHPYKQARQLLGGVLTLVLLMSVSLHAFAEFRDPLDWPADELTRLTERPTQAVEWAGERVVAVGAQGLIASSTDGQRWTQSRVPVQSDLLALDFPTSQHGWAVGHDGVILHSQDGGMTWATQLDGRQAKSDFNSYYADLSLDNDVLDAVQDAVSLNYAAGPTLPFLDVWFADAERGFVVGSFGTLAATNDGGRTWEPWLHRINNEELLNLNAVLGVGNEVYIAAERGVVFRLTADGQRFEPIDTGHDGSFFGLLNVGDSIIAYGLSGVAYRSDDQGDSWVALRSGSSVLLTAGTSLPEQGSFVLTNAQGDLLFGTTTSDVLRLQGGEEDARYTGVVPLDEQQLLMSSLEGFRTQATHVSAGK